MNAMKRLWEYFNEIMHFRYIEALLSWDEQVYMPKSSIRKRADQMALIRQLIHSRIKSKKTHELIRDAEELNDLSDIDFAMIREAKREYKQATKIPNNLIAEIAKTSAIGHIEWEKSRAKSDFSIFKPYLEKIIKLRKEFAEKLDTGPTLYSTLIDLFEPGSTYESILRIFNSLRPKLVQIVKKLNDISDKPVKSILKQHYEAEKQWQLSLDILKKLNFDFNNGRQDKATTIHECGHAFYQMGFKKQIKGTVLADGCSMGISESQSRLWENMVGRSKEFWNYWYPIYQKAFPENLKSYPLEKFYRSINVVEPSFIRVDADEVSYGLHIILRFEIEKMIIEDDFKVAELPELWNSKMNDLLGIIPPNDALGVLQDVHWTSGFGYF
ncbi:MAG: carboxypeptidase M32, partial [Candidatus Lokiarchaeota archaeon]